jgi:outer membrane protein assembly factor BamB
VFISQYFRTISIVSFALFIASCGGGGGGEGKPKVVEPSKPTLSGTPLLTVNENSEYEFTVISQNFNANTLNYSIENLPSWAIFDTSKGQLTGTPNYEQSGTYSTIKISASDGANTAVLSSFSIEVVNVNRLPVAVIQTEYEALESELISIPVEMSDPDLDDLSVTLENQPAWLSFDMETLSLVGQASLSDSGNYQLNIIINDGIDEISVASSIIIKDAIEVRGKVIDGYISGALVYIDENLNVIFDDAEISTRTDETGSYTLVLPIEKLDILSKYPVRAYIGAEAQDLSRPELDFTITPLTLSLPPLDISLIEHDAFDGAVVSPFSEQLFSLINDKIQLVISGGISTNELQFFIQKAKAVIINQVISSGGITIDANQSEDDISDIVFGDFIADAEDLTTIIEQAEAYIDVIISMHESADFDGDGIANNVDNDDDGDGIDDSVDIFPYNASEWIDTDDDNVGDNADFYPNNDSCFAVEDGNGEDCYINILAENSPTYISASSDEIVYFYQEDGTLVTFDITTNHILNTQQVENVTSMIFHEGHQRLYVGLNNGELKYLNGDFVLTDFSIVEQCVNALVDTDSFLIVLDCRGYVGNYVTFNSSGEQLGESDNYYDSSRSNAWNKFNNRLYHFRDGISPNDLYYRTISNSGEFTDVVESPYHGDYPITGPIAVSNDGTKILLGRGDIFSADSLTWLTSIGESFLRAFWLADGSLVTLQESENQEEITLKRRDVNLNLVEVRHFSGNLQEVKAFANRALLIIKDTNSLQFIDYLPSDDNDNDGVINTLDAFPLDSSASLDTDQDGFPDSWNDGFTASINNITLDEFPLDSACWLASHGNDNGCDFLATQPIFTPDQIIYDDEGNIYLLSSLNKRIYRWLSATNQFTNPIVISSSIYQSFGESRMMTYSSEHNRLYLGYVSGTITRFNLDELHEKFFANIGGDIRGLTSVGNFLLAEKQGSRDTHYILDEDGEITDSKDWSSNSDAFAWNDQDSRLYSIKYGSLYYQTINQALGHFEDDGSIYWDSWVSSPLRIFDDGKKVITGNGVIFDIVAQELVLNLDQQFIDVAPVSEQFITIENNDLPKLKIWQLENFSLFTELVIEGNPLALTPNGDELNLVTLETNGELNVSAIGIVDSDGDGLPLWWESLHNLDDDNAADAALDSDEDGLTNLGEFAAKTNPNLADTDDDGLLDGAEVNTHLTSPLINDTDQDGLSDGDEVNEYGTDPLLTDSDEDGLSDSEEVYIYQSNPLNNDSDGDGLSDFYEVNNQLDININDANEDADGDGLINIDEMAQQTDPNNVDSDNDGLNDGDEVHTYLTLPLNRDTDSDSMPDGWEISYAFDPLSSTDRAFDFDEDNYANYIEYFLESDPTNSLDIPVAKLWNSYQGNADHSGFSAMTIDPENLSLRWSVTLPLLSTNELHPVVAANGKVYVTNNSYHDTQFVFGINALNGGVNWQKSYGNVHSINAPTLNDNKLYFQTIEDSNSYLHALNAVNGDSVFSTSYGNQWSRYKAPTAFEGDIYTAGGTYGGSYKFDGQTGDELWFQDLQQCDGWTPAVDSDHLYYFSNGFVIADKSSGAAIEKNEEFDISCQTPVLAGSNTALVIYDNNLYAFDTQTADKIWSVETDDYANRFVETPSAALGKVYANKSGELIVLDQFSGEELWSWRPQNGNNLQGSIVLTLNIAFVQDNINTYAIDLDTHEQVWSYPVSGKISLSKEGALYIAGNNGLLTAIDFGIDSDNDGIDDWWEDLYGLDSQNAADALLNADSDELTNLEEFQNSTDPRNDDSDNDGLSDSDEVNVHSSNPLSSDTDNDGMADGWEVAQNFNLLNDEDALLDADNDGITNVEEYTEQTDPHDETSIPEIIASLTFSFEDAIIPMDWVVDDTKESSWGVSSIESSDGNYSIFSSGQSAISLSGFFNGNNLAFDVKSACQYNDYISVYIDGKQTENFLFGDYWLTGQVVIPRGRHTVSFEVGSCGVYLDNLQFTPLLSLYDLGVQSVTVLNQELHLYSYEQALISSIKIPVIDSDARDLTVLDDGRIAVFNGVFSPSLSIYNPIHATWSHKKFESWGIVNNGTYGGIAHFNDYVFVTDMSISGSDTAGIVRFNLNSNSEEFFLGDEYIDVTLGLDNMLYALSGRQIDKYDPESMELINSFTISAARAVAVNESGNIFTASWNGVIKQYDAEGVERQQLVLSDFYQDNVSSSFYDINVYTQNSLILTNRNQQILIVDSEFESIVLQEQNFRGAFITQVPLIDNDNDGMPMWWESKFELDDTDETDALTDLDSDGLTNFEEYELSTLPNNEDTDEDGLTDFDEVNTYLTKPLNSDTDNDGLTDGTEVLEYSTDPLEEDSDGDLFSDGDEINIYQTDPNDIDSKPESISQVNITFESGTIPSDFSHAENSDAQWLIENIAESGEDENYTLRSGDIENNQTSTVVWNNVFAAGTLTIDVNVSSESCCDRFYLLVDGVEAFSSVSSEWQTLTTELSSGQHSIEFRYQKDGSVSSGDDAVWLDNIIFESN